MKNWPVDTSEEGERQSRAEAVSNIAEDLDVRWPAVTSTDQKRLEWLLVRILAELEAKP